MAKLATTLTTLKMRMTMTAYPNRYVQYDDIDSNADDNEDDKKQS